MADSSPETAEQASSKRWSRLTIRGMLGVTMLLAVGLAYRTNIARREQPAIRLLRDHGCSLLYRHDIFGNLPSFAPRLVRQAAGVENFGSVVRLNFIDGHPRSDEAFTLLDRLPNVTVVNTDGALITDTGMAPVANLSHLTCLRLNNAKAISDQGVQHLSSLTELNLLDLSGTGITDQGLDALLSLYQVEILGLDNTLVSDDGIRKLGRLKRLRLLKLQRTNVTSKGVRQLQDELPECQIAF